MYGDFKRVRMVPVLIVTGFLFMATRFCNAAILSDDELLASAKEKGKLVADDFLSRAKAPNAGGFNYFDACAYYGSCLYGNAVDDSAYYKSVYDKYVKNKPGYISTGDVDKNSCGLLPLYLSALSGDQSLLELGKAAADNSVQHNGYQRTAVDDMYMTGSLMVQAFRATNDTSYLTFCADYVITYADKLLQPNGLYWHKLDSRNHWGRGNGWGAAGATELLQELPETHEKYQEVLEAYQKHMKGLIDVQKSNGMWMQLLDSTDPKNWEETSGTAMFVFALFTGLKNGWLEKEEFLEPAREGWNALVGYVQGSKLTQIAAGFWPSTGQPSDYLNASRGQPGDLHGTAAFLWAATAVIDYCSEPPIDVHHKNTRFHQSAHPMKVLSSMNPKSFFDLKGRVITRNNTMQTMEKTSSGVIINYGSTAEKAVNTY